MIKQTTLMYLQGVSILQRLIARSLGYHQVSQHSTRLVSPHSKEKVFVDAYKSNRWRNSESRSGPGSTLASTENLRRELPEIVRAHGVTRLLDARCGDFNWMRLVVPKMNIVYIGGDIVGELIHRNRQLYGSESICFRKLDITLDPLPASDLMIVRDCLFHFSYRGIQLFLENFNRSSILLLFTTTHVGEDIVNQDIPTGNWRRIDIFSCPFFFPDNPIRRVTDCKPGGIVRELCLFNKTQVIEACGAMAQYLEALESKKMHAKKDSFQR